MSRYFTLSGVKFTRFWHCFGNENHMAPLDMVKGFLNASKTNVIPINTHNFTAENKNQDFLEVGYAGVPFHELSKHMDTEPYIKMLNINLQTTAQQAIDKTKIVYDILGFPIVKLEVLDASHEYSNQAGIVEATKSLIEWDKNLKIYPLFANDLDTAKRLIDVGAKLLRVMGSGIGSCAGLPDIDTFSKICDLGVPVILDGGIGKIEHAKQAMDAGATGILINSMLFKQGRDPVAVMEDFARGYEVILDEMTVAEPA